LKIAYLYLNKILFRMQRTLLCFILLIITLPCFPCDPVVCNYRVKGNRVYYTEGSHKIIVKGINSGSFGIVKDANGQDAPLYAKDNKSVFYRGKKIEKADPETFEVLGGLSGFYIDGYSKDKNHIYFSDYIINADIESFILINNEGFVKDKNHIFWEDQITHYDASTFRILPHDYTIDKSGIYYNGFILPGADPNSFEQYECYIKSNNTIFLQSTPTTTLPYDAASFKVVKAYLSTDSCGHSSFYGAIVKDKNGVYSQLISLSFGSLAEKLPFDSQSFEMKDEKTVFQDKNGVYNIKFDPYHGTAITKLSADSSKF